MLDNDTRVVVGLFYPVYYTNLCSNHNRRLLAAAVVDGASTVVVERETEVRLALVMVSLVVVVGTPENLEQHC